MSCMPRLSRALCSSSIPFLYSSIILLRSAFDGLSFLHIYIFFITLLRPPRLSRRGQLALLVVSLLLLLFLVLFLDVGLYTMVFFTFLQGVGV